MIKMIVVVVGLCVNVENYQFFPVMLGAHAVTHESGHSK
jgi:hypothetical protein